MKQMEYTVKLTFESPVSLDSLNKMLKDIGASMVEITSFRVKPIPRKAAKETK